MNILSTIGCRAFQTGMKWAIPFPPYREPKILHSVQQVPALLQDQDISCVLLVTDRFLHNSGLIDPLKHALTASGMGALTHAIEAYIGHSTTQETQAYAIRAATLVAENLEKSYHDGNDMVARSNMLNAAYLGGSAFSRSYVGYCHAVAHSLGGKYHTPHGLANAVLLPIILEDYGPAAHKGLAELADAVGIGGATAAEKAENFIAAIRAMNERMGIPEGFDCIREEDLPRMTAWAEREANPLYPVPVIYGEKDFARVLCRAML